MVGNQHGLRDVLARETLDVGHLGTYHRGCAVTVLSDLPAERHILSEHEITLVEAPDLFKHVTANQEAGPRDPVN